MAPKELLALRLLMDNPRGLYGSEFVHMTSGKISRGTVYTLLDRLVDKGHVREEEENPTPELQIKRTRHFVTKEGRQACEAFAEELGFAIKHGALAG